MSHPDPRHPPASAREVRILGLVFLAAALAWWKSSRPPEAAGPSLPWQAYPAALFALLGILCVTLGARARPIHRAWSALGVAMGAVVSPVVMALLYYLLFTPFALAVRLVRRDPLGQRPDASLPTYWSDPSAKKTDRRRLLRQY